jgi:O-antigen/teichoic acid export membrane protein
MARLSADILSLVRGASFVFLCRVTGAGLAFLTQVLMARWMGAEALGVYVFAFSSCLLLGTLTGLGIPAAAIKLNGSGLARSRGDLIVGFSLRSSQIVGIVGLIAALLGALVIMLTDLVEPGERRTALLLAFLTVPIFGLSSSRAAVALGMSWITLSIFPNTVFRPLLFLCLIGGFWYFSGQLSPTTAMALQTFAVVLMTLGQWLLTSRGLKETFPETAPSFETRTWVRTALPLLVIALFTNYFLEVNIVVAGLHLDDGQLAMFNAGFRIAALIAFGIAAVDTILMPRVSKMHAAEDLVALQRTVSHAAQLRFWGSLAVSVPLVFAGEWVLGLFGEEFVAGYPALLILTGSQLAAALFGPAARLLSVTGYQDQCLWVSLAAILALFVLHPLLIGWWGLNGAALAVLLVVLLHSAWLCVLAARHLNVRSMAFFNRTLPASA